VRPLRQRGPVWLIPLSAAIAAGAAGWLLGPVWAAVGLVLGPLATVLAVATWQGFRHPDPLALLKQGRPSEALARIQADIPGWRISARTWPGQFRDALADGLWVLSLALQACGRNEEAIAAAQESVAIYRDLNAARPGRFAAKMDGVLKHLTELLVAANRDEEAKAVMKEAIQLWRNSRTCDHGLSAPGNRDHGEQRPRLPH
jgi:tetratricopeptide (TPR) repeat protein